MAKQRTLASWRRQAKEAQAELRLYRLDPPKPGAPYVRRSCRGGIHWGGFRNGQMYSDCLFDFASAERWLVRGGRWEQW